MGTNIQNAANAVTEFKEKNEKGQSELKKTILIYIKLTPKDIVPVNSSSKN